MVLAWNQAKARTQPDSRYQGMLKNKKNPFSWYIAVFVLCFIAGLWGSIISLILGAFIAPFSCILYGLYGIGVGTNALSKMVAGALHPGRSLANL